MFLNFVSTYGHLIKTISRHYFIFAYRQDTELWNYRYFPWVKAWNLQISALLNIINRTYCAQEVLLWLEAQISQLCMIPFNRSVLEKEKKSPIQQTLTITSLPLDRGWRYGLARGSGNRSWAMSFIHSGSSDLDTPRITVQPRGIEVTVCVCVRVCVCVCSSGPPFG